MLSKVAIDIVTSYKGQQDVLKAQKQLSLLDSTVSKLGKTLGKAFAGYEVARFANSSLKAFTADNLAAKQLALTLTNLGLGFDSKRVEMFIQTTEKLTGVLDEQLRPAMQLFLNTTGSVTRSQGLLNTALNISRATGKDLASVSTALARAYQGNYTSLQRLGIGVDVATMKTQGFAQVQDTLNKKFGGAAQLAADSYQGSLDKLKVAADNAKEAIGKGLVDALAALSSSGTIDGTVSAIDKISAAFGRAIGGAGRFIAYTKAVFLDGKSAQAAKALVFPEAQAKPQTRGAGRLAVDLANQRAAAEKKVTDAIKTKAAADARANAALLKQKSDQLKLDQASALLKKSQSMFDLQAIEIAAALQNDRLTADEKLRLQMMATQDQLAAAIQDKNVPAVDALITAIGNLQSAFENLSKVKIDNPFQPAIDGAIALQSSLYGLNAALQATRETNGRGSAFDLSNYLSLGLSSALQDARNLNGRGSAFDPSNYLSVPRPGAGATQSVQVTISADPGLVATVQQGIVNNTASGNAAVYSRSSTARVGDW